MIDHHQPDYSDTPVSARRPRFSYAPADAAAEPLVSVVTPFHHPGTLFRDTARAVFQQSLQRWEWIIVNDATPDPESRAILDEFRHCDPRVRVLDHARTAGPAAARNTGARAARSEFLYLLDDDDLIEPTALEKLIWFLVTNPRYAFASSWSVGFGNRQYLWTQGFHDGDRLLRHNLVTGRVMIRRQVFEAVGGQDETIRHGFEDWDLWLRCADRGLWGGTLREFLEWYRRREDHSDRWRDFAGARRLRAFRQGLRQRYPNLYRSGVPRLAEREPVPYERPREGPPFANPLAKERPRLLLLVPWMAIGGADKFNLDVVRLLTGRGWEVTIASTLAGDAPWTPQFTRLTPDVFELNHFLALGDRPAFLRYLIESRRPDVVLITHSEFGYLMLPYLRAHCPEPAYVDYCHIDEPDWKNGGYPRFAVGMQACLDRNLVSSQQLKGWMVARGADPDRIEVIYTNVDVRFWRRRPRERRRLRERWGASQGDAVVLFAGRLCAQKQPRVLARTLRELSRRGVRFRALVAGDGPDRGWLEAFVRRHGLRQRVRLLGAVPNRTVRTLMAASDVFFLPSRWEGVSLALFEAMAMELATVSADVGGQRELLTPDCGILVARGDEETEVRRYADALQGLLSDPERCRTHGERARQRVCRDFRLEQLGDRLLTVFEAARKRAAQREAAPVSPSLALEWVTQALESMRLSHTADALWREVRGGLRADSALSGRGFVSRLQVEAELDRIESSRSWRLVQRFKRNPLYRMSARVRFGPGWDPPRESEDPLTRLHRITASRSYRLVEALKKGPASRLYARRRDGAGSADRGRPRSSGR